MENMWNPTLNSVILQVRSNDAKIHIPDTGTQNPLTKPGTGRNTKYGLQETFPYKYFS
jgi:hypothetical protein